METLNWRLMEFPNQPGFRTGGGMVGDATNGSILLVGGIGGRRGILNDFWTLMPGGWMKNADTTALPPRTEMGIAYDEKDGILLVFGGHGNGRLQADTWAFDGSAWKLLQTDVAPPPRQSTNLVFDAAQGLFVLFGGSTNQEKDGEKIVVPLGDTWLWDGSGWNQASPDVAPAARYGAGMVYDTSRQVTLLFGGQGQDDFLNDTWLWDGTTWQLAQPAHSPSPRAYASVAYHADKQRTFLFGGLTLEGPRNDTWAWDGQDWTEVETETQPPLDIATVGQMSYHPQLKNILILAGRLEKPADPSGEVRAKSWSEMWALE